VIHQELRTERAAPPFEPQLRAQEKYANPWQGQFGPPHPYPDNCERVRRPIGPAGYDYD
jgi:hypothetical protein